MAKLNLLKRKEIAQKELKIEFDGLFEDVVYKVSEEILQINKQLQKEQENFLKSKLAEKLNIKDFLGKSSEVIQQEFLNKFSIEELFEIQEKSAKDFKFTEKFFFSIKGTPEKEELKSKLSEELGSEELGKEAYYSLINDTFLEIKELLESLKKPR